MDMKTVTYRDKVTGKTDSYEIPVSAKTPDEIRTALKPLVLKNRESFKQEKEAPRAVVPSGVFTPFPMIAPPEREDAKSQQDAYQAQQDVLTEYINTMALFGLPTKGLSLLGVEGPQEKVESARARLPFEATLGAQLMGGIPTAVAAGPAVFRGVSKVPVLSGAIAPVRAAVASGLEGLGTYLGGTSRGEETLTGAGISTLAGPLFTAVGTPLGRALEFATRKPREQALRTIGDLMSAPRGPSATALTADELAIIAGEPKPVTVAEQIGGEAEGLEPLVERAIQNAGPEGRVARDIAIEKMAARAEGRPTRVFESAEGFPTSQRVDELMENIELDKTKSGEIYSDAYKTKFEPTDKIVNILGGKTDFRRSANKAVRILNNEIAADLTEPVTVLKVIKPEIKDEAGKIIQEEVKERVALTAEDLIGTKNIANTLETTENPTIVVDYMLRGFDDLIQKTKGKQSRRALSTLKYSLLDEMKEVNPSFLDARDAYAGVSSRQNAMEFGKDILDLKPDEFKTFISKMSQDEKEYFSVGVMDFIKEELAKPGLGKLKTIKIGEFENPITKRLRFAFPDDEAYAKFASNLQDEAKMLELEKIGKLNLQESEGIFNRIMSALYVRQRPGAGTAVFVNVSNAARRLLSKAMNPDESEEVVSILMANTPSQRTAILDDLVRSEQISKLVADEVQEVVSQYTAPLRFTTTTGIAQSED
jgi:hypothetical protein